MTIHETTLTNTKSNLVSVRVISWITLYLFYSLCFCLLPSTVVFPIAHLPFTIHPYALQKIRTPRLAGQ